MPKLTRLLAACTATFALVISGTTTAVANEPSPDGQAIDTAGFLGRQLEKNNYVLPGFAGPDWGLTIDALFGLAATGRSGKAAAKTVDKIVAEGWKYGQWSCYSDVGSFAKTALALQVGGADPTKFNIKDSPNRGDICDQRPRKAYGSYFGDDTRDVVNLIGILRDQIAMNNGRAGLDSNHFDQTLTILALARTKDGVPKSAIDYVKSLQCLDPKDPDYGGLGYDDNKADTSPCETVDGDATGFMLSGLLAAGLRADDPVVEKTVTWMKVNQAADGSFVASWSGAGNTNSTGLVGNAARQIGTAEANAIADKADAYLRKLMVGLDDPISSEDDPTQPGFARSWVGAIAYDQAAFDKAKKQGIQSNEEDQWRRATPQAVLGIASLPAWSKLTLRGNAAGTPEVCEHKTFAVSAPSGYQSAGRKVPVSVKGARPGEKLRAAVGYGGTADGKASAKGTATLYPVSKAAGTQRVRMTGECATRTGTSAVKILGAKSLPVSVKYSKRRVNSYQKFVAKGLAPSERFRIYYAGKKIKDAKAPKSGTVSIVFKVGSTTGKKRIGVVGQFENRKGIKYFTVTK